MKIEPTGNGTLIVILIMALVPLSACCPDVGGVMNLRPSI